MVMLREYESLMAELRTLLTLGFGVITVVGATVAAALAASFQLEEGQVLVAFPAIAIGIAAALTEFHMYYLSLGSYVGSLEIRINSILKEPPVLGWHSRAIQMAWSSPPTAGALHHDLGVAFAGTALFILILILGAEYLTDLDQPTWKSALYAAAYSLFYAIPWILVVYRFLFVNPQRLSNLEEGLRQANPEVPGG